MSSCMLSLRISRHFANRTPVKQFIRSVRASKTIADERAVVQKESAAIRASFREESGDANIRCGSSQWTSASIELMYGQEKQRR